MPPTNRLPSEPDSPAAGAPAGQDASALWLVSYGDDDDRELTPSQIAVALRNGEIDGTTIVWRDGLPDWLPIASVPALAALIPQGGETTTAPVAITNIAPEPKPAPTEDVTTAPGLGDAGGAANTAKPVAKISLKAAPQPRSAEEATTAKPGEAAVDASGKPAWRGKTKIGLPKVDVQRPEIARRLEPVKAPAAAAETTAKPPATATPRPATGGAKPAPTTSLGTKPAGAAGIGAKPAAAKAPEAPRPAAAKPPEATKPVEAPKPVEIADEPEPETVKPSALAAAAVLKPDAVPEHSPEAPTAKLPEVTKPEAAKPEAARPEAAKPDVRKPPLPPHRPPARSTIAGVGVTLGNLGGDAAKGGPRPPARAPQAPAQREPFVSGKTERDRESHPPVSARAGGRGATNIWENDDEPISVDPTSVRPPMHTPSPNIAKATALSSGTLGLSMKPAPKPPTPKGAPKPPPAPAPEKPIELQPGTPSLQALSAPLSTRTEEERVDDLLHLQAAPPKVGILAPNTFAPPAPTPPPPPPEPVTLEDLPSDIVVEAEDAQPTRPFGLEAPLEALTRAPAPSEPKAAPSPAATAKAAPASASTPPPARKKRSLVPFFVVGAIAAVGISVGLRQMGGGTPAEPAPVEQPPAPQTPVAEAPKAEPAPAPEPPAEPPAPAPEPPAAKAEPPHSKPSTPVVESTAPRPSPAPKAEPTPRPEPAEKPEPAAKKPAAAPAEKAVDMGGEFDRAAAASALGAAATAAAGCRKDGDPSGLAVVKVTFTNSGKATRAVIEGPPFAGTATGGCIAAQMRGAKVPPFGGDRVTVTKRVVIQ